MAARWVLPRRAARDTNFHRSPASSAVGLLRPAPLSPATFSGAGLLRLAAARHLIPFFLRYLVELVLERELLLLVVVVVLLLLLLVL